MQMLIKALSTVALFGGAVSVCADPMTQKDREHLVAHLGMTQSWMMSEVASLSSAQFNFRPAPDRWTIAEVLQHLAVAEPKYWKLLNDGLKQSPKKLPKQASDADVLWYGIDRTRHDKTSVDENPKGEEINTHQALQAFLAMHAKMLEMARSTTEDLRSHAVPEWDVDAYQCLLEISTHEQRHILQIREVKADAGFPKH